MALSDAALAIRQRLFDDFEFYALHCLKIRTKDQKIAPFVLNKAQKRLLELVAKQLTERGYVRIIILKGRQMGLSTMVGGFLYWWVSQRSAQKALVVAHKGPATDTLFTMTRRFHDKAPEAVKPSTRYSSKKELVFDQLDSAYTLVTAGGDGIARSETITAAHLSELAFWPPSTARENFSGLMDTVPTEPGTIVFIESTANGVAGLFAEQCDQAIAGKSSFEFIFLPWFIDEGYTLPVPKDFKKSPEEIDIAKKYGLKNGQLVFRRKKISEKGRDLFMQEYPCNAQEAFLTSGRPVFISEMIAELLTTCPEPLAKMGLEGGTFVADPRGELLCYEGHDPGAAYYIGADVGAGVQRDWSVAQVFHSSGRQAAVFRAQVDPDYFATILEALGKFYNDAKIIVESNNHGILTCSRLGKDMAYVNFYTETVYDKVTDTETLKLGFNTNVKSKPLIIDKLRADMREGRVLIRDKTTLEEMRSFIVTETGKMEAEQGCHDDCVMSLALAAFINEGEFIVIENQDKWFVTTI